MNNPIMDISGSEPALLKEKLKDISLVDNKMVYPDYKIYSKFGYTIGISRARTNDLISNKLDVASHVAEELHEMHTDIKIFLMEDWMGMDHNKKVSLPGGRKSGWNYTLVINTVLIACIANNALWVPSASLNATAELLKLWNNEIFQREKHESLNIRPRPADIHFDFTLNNEELNLQDKIWWLAQMPKQNLGVKRATNLLIDSGEKLINVFMKTREQLEQSEQVGRGVADNFRKFLDR